MGDEAPADRLAIVTGTSAGIGAAVASRLLDKGWQVIGVARRPAVVRHDRYAHVALDLSRIDELEPAMEDAAGPVLRGRGWAVVGLVNNAADVGALRRIEEQHAPQIRRTFDVNVVAPAWLMGFVLRAAPAGAAIRIVNVSSGAASHGYPGLNAYGASKSALRMIGMAVAAEVALPDSAHAARDCSIVTYEPGLVDTEMQTTARTQSPAFPLLQMFKQFKYQKQLVPPPLPAAEIVTLLEGSAGAGYADRALALAT